MLLAILLSFAAAAPPDLSGHVARLASDDPRVRREAFEQLCALDQDAVPLLRRLAVKSLEVDVRIALYAAAGAIRARHWGPIKAMGPGASLTSPPPHGGYWFNRVRFSRDGKQAIVAGGALIRYDLATGKEEGRVMEVGGARPGLAVGRNGKLALTSHYNDRDVHLVELTGLKTAVKLTGHWAGVPWCALSPDGKSVATASSDRTARVWDAATGKERFRFADLGRIPVGLAFTADGREVVLGEHDQARTGVFLVHDAATGKHLRTLAHPTPGVPTSLVCHPDGKTMLVTTADGFLLRLRLSDGKELLRLKHGGQVNEAALAPDGRRVLTAGFHDRTVKVWDLDAGTQLDTFEGHLGGVLGVDFSPDGTRALSCDTVATVRLWKVGR